MGFKTPTVKVETADGRNVVLLEPMVYVTRSGEEIVVPAGATSDGASTPKLMWNLIPPFGVYWKAAVLHDFLYRCTDRPRPECDRLLLEAMESLNVETLERDAIYEGVREFGNLAFLSDRKKP